MVSGFERIADFTFKCVCRNDERIGRFKACSFKSGEVKGFTAA